MEKISCLEALFNVGYDVERCFVVGDVGRLLRAWPPTTVTGRVLGHPDTVVAHHEVLETPVLLLAVITADRGRELDPPASHVSGVSPTQNVVPILAQAGEETVYQTLLYGHVTVQKILNSIVVEPL